MSRTILKIIHDFIIVIGKERDGNTLLPSTTSTTYGEV